MKKLAVISAVVFTTITLQSCRQSDDIMSPDEAATLQRVQDSSNNQSERYNIQSLKNEPETTTPSSADGEIVPPPRR